MNDTVSPARQSAFDVLRRVAMEDALAGPLLAAPRQQPLSPADQHLRQELTLGVLRRQGWLDFLIECYSGRRCAKIDPEVLIALRLGLYQLKVLTRIPAHAAINESVNLVKLARKRSAAPFVNAVLRAAQRADDLPEKRLPADPLDRLSILASVPRWILERWSHRWGLAETTALAIESSLTPDSTFRYNEAQAPREMTDRWLEEHGVRIRPSKLVPGAAVIEEGSLAPDSPPVEEGWVYFQEESSQLAARLAVPIESVCRPIAVWDVCAAPGGKSTLIASLLPAGSQQVATDRVESRLRLMKQLFGRQQLLERISVAEVDLTGQSPFAPDCFDRILVDAPCSGLGTIQKHPEIKWRLTPERIAELASRQRAILETAALSLRPGGLLTYAVCSTEAEEGEDVVAWFRDRHREYRDLTRERLLGIGLDPESFITPTFGARTFPHRHHTEGFFVCVLWKRS